VGGGGEVDVVDEEDDATAGLLVAGSLRLSYEDLYGEKETGEGSRTSGRALVEEDGAGPPELLNGAAPWREQGRRWRRARAAARSGEGGN
jgi:hypothetical protein